MKQWDGIVGNLQYIGSEELYKNKKSGSIYYKDSGGAFCVWCVADRLQYHMYHLYQITRRSAHDEKTKNHIVNII